MWLGGLVHWEIWWMLWSCGFVYMYIGGFCWWLWIFGLDSNYVSYLLVLIHLVNIFDDNHFGKSNEVKYVYVWIYILHCLCWLWLMWSLPPVVLTAYLFVWMGRRSARVVLLGEYLDSESIFVIVSWSLRLGSD